MKYNQIVLPLFLILSTGAQSIFAHGELFKFNVHESDVTNCAKAQRIANIFAPTSEDLVENFCSDEKVTIPAPKVIASAGKVELTKKGLAKMVLVGAEFIKKTQHHLKFHRLHHAMMHAAKSVCYDVVKDQVIGFAMDKGASCITVPEAVKNSTFFAAAGYAAGKAAGFALNVAIDAGIARGKAWVFHPRHP